MIKANEIRVGNIFIGYDDKPFAWGLKEFSFIEPDVAISIDEIIKAPIKLNEEILIKCGFIETKLFGWYSSKIGDIEIIIRFHSKIAYCEIGGIYFGDRFKYLHELQNIWRYMSGQEINISKI